MTNTKKSLLVAGGLVLSYALVVFDTVGVSSVKDAAVPGGAKKQEKETPIRIQNSPFTQGLFK